MSARAVLLAAAALAGCGTAAPKPKAKAKASPPPVSTIGVIPTCHPASTLDRVTHHGRRYTFTGSARTYCEQPVTRTVLLLRRGGATRRVATHGTSAWQVTVRLRPGRYRVASLVHSQVGVEGRKRGRALRVR